MKILKAKNYYESQGISELCEADKDFLWSVLFRLADFVRNNWGNVNQYSKLMNNRATITGGKIIGSYLINDIKIWIIASPEDSKGLRNITILLPEEF